MEVSLLCNENIYFNLFFIIMSVIRDLSHHKKNVVLELFGNSKRHIP